MRVIAKSRLRDFWQAHAGAEAPLLEWWKIATKAEWTSLQDVRQTLPSADGVALAGGLVITVFNIGGKSFRLLTRIVYDCHLVYIAEVLTHAEYNKNLWKGRLSAAHQRSAEEHEKQAKEVKQKATTRKKSARRRTKDT